MKRVGMIAAFACLFVAAALAQTQHVRDYAQVRPGAALSFPRDDGSHPRFRTEWWYITGWLHAKDGRDLGMQITFFRNRPGVAENLNNRFAPTQLLFAHAALADPKSEHLIHDQRSARAGFGLAQASEERTDIVIDDWSLKEEGDRYVAHIVARDFDYALEFRATQSPLLQGAAGVSRKGPKDTQASFYYSRPQLQVSGSMRLRGRQLDVTGTAWLDHEWSSEYLAPDAVGWDWAGINLADGSALMAFHIRDRAGGVFWSGGSHRDADGGVRVFAPHEVTFTPLRRWRSPRTQAEYPIEMRIRAGNISLTLAPLMDDQELDARASTATIYWEGAVRAMQEGKVVGLGYLELTGYWKPLKL